MDIKEKLCLLEELLDVEEGSLRAEDKMEEMEEWDSMTVLSLIVLLDEKFGKQISGKQIKALQTIDDILKLME